MSNQNTTTTTVVNTGDHRLVGWGNYASLRGSIQHRLFGFMVSAALPVVKEYHGDLFIDSESMTKWLDETFAQGHDLAAEASFLYCVRHSGTHFGPFARFAFDSHAYDAVLYNFEVRVDARGEWHLRIDLIDVRPTRPTEAEHSAAALGLNPVDSCVSCDIAGRTYNPDKHDSQNCWA